MTTAHGASDDAAARILSAAHAQVLTKGGAGGSSGAIAEAAGVSKALVHYHFADRRRLSVAVASLCTARVAARAARQDLGADVGQTLRHFTQWLEQELNARDIDVLLRLSQDADDLVRQQAVEGVESFRAEIGRWVRGLFERLGTSPSIGVTLAGDVVATATIGLVAQQHMVGRGRAEREAVIDAVWLGLLGLVR